MRAECHFWGMDENKQARCLQCGNLLTYGRVDRVFSSLTSKNRYHNRHRGLDRNKEIKKVFRILENNRDLLEKLLKMGLRNVDRLTLLHLGYNINYFTSLQKLRHRWVYTCLDIRYELTPTRVKNISFLWDGEEEMVTPIV